MRNALTNPFRRLVTIFCEATITFWFSRSQTLDQPSLETLRSRYVDTARRETTLNTNHPTDPTLRHRRYFVTGRPGRDDRAPLPAGHPMTWGLINRGTTLETAPYPFPVFI
jgi:hypothetical protein